jgi:hypothetical protein
MRLLGFVAIALPLLGQSWYPKHNFTVGLGAAQPRADLAGPFSDSATLGIHYGYRFHRYFQLDAGLDTIFFSARVRDFFPTELFGDRRIRDYQFLIPFGGRVILPVDAGRMLVSAGGGGAHLRYTELISQPSDYFSIDARCATRETDGRTMGSSERASRSTGARCSAWELPPASIKDTRAAIRSACFLRSGRATGG